MYSVQGCTTTQSLHPPRNHLRLEDESTILGTYTDGRLPRSTLSPPLTLPLISRFTSRSRVSTTRPATPVEASERFTVYGHCTQTGPPPSRHQLPGIWTRTLSATRSAATGEPSFYELCYTAGRAPIYFVHTFQVPARSQYDDFSCTLSRENTCSVLIIQYPLTTCLVSASHRQYR
jgi:hypothetical protein